MVRAIERPAKSSASPPKILACDCCDRKTTGKRARSSVRSPQCETRSLSFSTPTRTASATLCANWCSRLPTAEIGAVSGHAKVGNLRSFIARCQALEYTVGFNLDRRAYTRWNCITVVPGAISAIRKSAIDEVGRAQPRHARGRYRSDSRFAQTRSTHRLCAGRNRVDRSAGNGADPGASTFSLGLRHACNVSGNIATLFSTGTIARSAGSVCRASGFSKSSSSPSRRWWICFLLASLPFGAWRAVLPFVIVFLAMDVILATLACILERESILRAWRILPMRLIYRPMLSYVIWKAILRAAQGRTR